MIGQIFQCNDSQGESMGLLYCPDSYSSDFIEERWKSYTEEFDTDVDHFAEHLYEETKSTWERVFVEEVNQWR